MGNCGLALFLVAEKFLLTPVKGFIFYLKAKKAIEPMIIYVVY